MITWLCSHLACLSLSSAQLVTQKELQRFQIFLSHVGIDFVQRHPDRKRIIVKYKQEKQQTYLGIQTLPDKLYL